MVGCQDLQEEFSSKNLRRDSAILSSPGESKSLMRTTRSFHGKSSNKYSLKEELSSECGHQEQLYEL